MKIYPISLLLIIFFLRIDTGAGMHGGNRVTGNEFNYQVSIRTKNRHWCGGAIINEWHILTAGHCVSDYITDQISVLAGSNCLNSDCGLLRKVRRIYYPADYERIQVSIGSARVHCLKNDIAVLALEEPLILGPTIATIPLPHRDPAFDPDQSICKVAGWGLTEISGKEHSNHLMWTSWSLVNSQWCRSIGVLVLPKFICTRHPNGESTLLHGDSGSPLVCKGILVGVASTTGIHSTATFVNVHRYLSFIHDAIRKNQAYQNSYMETKSPKKRRPCTCF